MARVYRHPRHWHWFRILMLLWFVTLMTVVIEASVRGW
jgi:hypothetical protein